MANLITALDIGSSQIKGVVAAEKKDGTFNVISVFKHPSAGLRRGVLVEPDEATRALRELTLDLRKISKKATENVIVNVNSEHVKTRPSRGIAIIERPDREIREEDVERAIQAACAVKAAPNHMVLHKIVREFFVDDIGDIHNPVGMTGNRLEVNALIIEAFSPHVNLLVKCLRQAGVKVGGLIFNSLAASRAVLSRQQKELGVLLIDVGFGTTTIAVHQENKVLYVKSLPIGAAYITNDIAIGLKTSIEVAEKLKLTYGYALAKDISRRDTIKLAEFDPANKTEMAKRFLAEIIEIRLAELLDIVNNELKVLGHIQLPAGAVITGGGVKLPGVSDLIKQELRLSVQIGFPNLSPLEIMNPTHQEMLDDPEFATTIGLILLSATEKKEPAGFWEILKRFFRNLFP